MKLAHHFRKSLTQVINEFDDVELVVWKAWDEIYGLDDVHQDLSILATMMHNFLYEQKVDGTHYLRREVENPNSINTSEGLTNWIKSRRKA